MIIKAKNIDSVNHSYPGWVLAPNQEITLTEADILRWRASDAVLDDIHADKLQIGDEVGYLASHSDQIQHLMLDEAEKTQVEYTPPFSGKTLPDGSKLFRRKTGLSGVSIDNSATETISYTVTYTHCKITGIEAINTDIGDVANFEVYDDAAGTYSGYPNAKLNQFGFSVNMKPSTTEDRCSYDADLYAGMVLKISYTNNSGAAKTVYVNLDLHEVV